MKDLDARARGLAQKMRGLNDHEDNDFALIKSALSAYGDECAREMREKAAKLVNSAGCSSMTDATHPWTLRELIRAIPLYSESGE